MQAKTGIEKHGQRAVAAIMKEYMQLTSMEVMGVLRYDNLTHEQKKKALRAINLIKEKRNGILKGRTVADGRGQRGYVAKQESASPALHLDPFIVSLVVDAFGGRDVGFFGVPGAFLQAMFPKEKNVILKFKGEFVDIMVDCNPKYANEVRMENGKKYYISDYYVHYMDAWRVHSFVISCILKSSNQWVLESTHMKSVLQIK